MAGVERYGFGRVRSRIGRHLVNVGDLVKMLPSYYGDNVPDQWAGLTGILTRKYDDGWWAALVKHPDDSCAEEIVIRSHDVEVVNDESF